MSKIEHDPLYGSKPILTVIDGQREEEFVDPFEVEEPEGPFTNYPDPESEEAESFAEEVVNRILNARAEGQRIKEGYRPRLLRAQAVEQGCLWHYGKWLETYTQTRLKKSKSVLLPNGIMGYRKQQEKIEVLNEEEAIKWVSTTAFEGDRAKLAGLCVIYKYTVTDSLLTQMLGSTTVGPTKLELTITALDASWLQSRIITDYHRFLVEGGVSFDSKAALTYYKATGDLPGGCRYIPERDEFYVSEPRKGKE